MRILVACEFSQVVCEAFTKKGHNVMSCDLLKGEKGLPHYQGDVRDILYDGFDMLLGFPPCTFLTVTANKWYKPEYESRYPTRKQDREDAINFFKQLAHSRIHFICLENPVGVMSTRWRPPDQIIQPWMFGDAQVKKTCLWLKRLPKLVPTNIVEPQYKEYNSTTHKSGKSKYPILWTNTPNAKERGRTFQGIADAMAEQWNF